MTVIALVRHGQSEWNLQNRFTGWWDVQLTEKGEGEATRSGELLAESGVDFRQCFSSVQTRAIRTLWLALTAMNRCWLPVTKDYRLNERHYGGLTGLNKTETAEKHGDEQVKIWRRSYDVPPPEMEAGTEFDLSSDPRYDGINVPMTESLELTLERVLPYWDSDVAPVIKGGTNTIIAAHGNSLRAIVKHLFDVSKDDIIGVEIPTGNPLLIELDDNLKPVSARYLDESRAKDLPPIK